MQKSLAAIVALLASAAASAQTYAIQAGRVIVDAIFQRDYPFVMATSFIFAVMVVLGNLIADLLYAIADLLKIAGYWRIGFLDSSLLLAALAATPVLVFGAWLGARANRRIPRRVF